MNNKTKTQLKLALRFAATHCRDCIDGRDTVAQAEDSLRKLTLANESVTYTGDTAARAKRYQSTLKGKMAKAYSLRNRLVKDAKHKLNIAKVNQTERTIQNAKSAVALAKKHRESYMTMVASVMNCEPPYMDATDSEVKAAGARYQKEMQVRHNPNNKQFL